MEKVDYSAIDIKSLKFDATKNNDFVNDLRKRVNAYFNERKISKQGNAELYIKTAVTFALFLIPYFLMLTGTVQSIGMMYLSWVVMGIATATIGTCIMHDAIHGSFS